MNQVFQRNQTKKEVITAAIVALGLAIFTANPALALSANERWNVGHHEGALQASIDEQTGYYNADCQRYDNSISHTDSYCSGYGVGYDVNWHIFKDRHIVLSTNVQAKLSQEVKQSASINCFLAICGKNSIGQRSSESQSLDTNTASNSGN